MVCPHPPTMLAMDRFPVLTFEGSAAEVVGPLYLVRVVGAELVSLHCPICLEESTLLADACAAFDMALRHSSSLDSIAATLAIIGLGYQDLISTFSGKLAALLRTALPFSTSTLAAYAAWSRLA